MACGRRLSESQVIDYALRYGAPDPYVATAIAYVESGYCADSEGWSGECGIMQVLPSTAREVAGRYVSCEELKNPAIGMAIGVRYLKKLWEELKSPVLAISAYNTGPSQARRGKINWNYVDKVLKKYSQLGPGGPVIEHYSRRDKESPNQSKTTPRPTFCSATCWSIIIASTAALFLLVIVLSLRGR